MRRANTPWASQAATNSSNAAGSPLSTVEAGLLSAATDTRWLYCVSRWSTWAAGNPIAAIPPNPTSSAIAWLRRATTFAASSKLSPPATYAAAISPWE
ncbi:hypothetical protein MSIMFI_05618 [Mycobacterium simulans]|nr:hypothetical protein MSIMFI_05618 [Mycobacterium simulans]